jgi:tRNA(Ile)-lysidine synthetase-like protein
MLLRTLETTIITQQLAPMSGPWLVAVSGGADSLALLHGLIRLQPRLGCRLHVATFDHRVRVPAGADDAAYVRTLANDWGIPATIGTTDVPALAAEAHLSIEAAARLARYRFLAHVARQVGATHVATAHNADDQAETVLMHLLRGAGLTGLRGMAYAAPLPEAPDLRLTRPLLDVTRAEVEAYCIEVGLQPRHDETNLNRDYLRNRLRLDIIPQLREINPQVGRQLRQLAEAATQDAAFIDQAFIEQIAVHATVAPASVRLSLTLFRAAHTALQRRFIVWAARQLVAHVEVSYVQQRNACDVAVAGQVGMQATLPEGLRLRMDYDALVIEIVAAPSAPPDVWLLPPNSEMVLAVPGVTTAGDRSIYMSEGEIEGAAATLTVPVGARVWLRTRRAGDRLAPPGLDGHTQKLKDWLINHRVPQSLRDRLPLLMVNDEIAVICWGERWLITYDFRVLQGSEPGHIVSVWIE